MPKYWKAGKCSAAPNAGGNCFFTDAISLCDEAADCSDYPSGPNDPAVCCFTRGGLQQGRECTTASACAAGAASAYGFTILPGFMGMESTTKCVATKAFYRSPRSTH